MRDLGTYAGTEAAQPAHRTGEAGGGCRATGVPWLAAVGGNTAVGRMLNRSAQGDAPVVPVDFADKLGRGRGSPIPDDTRVNLEAGLGTSLSEVRLHTDSLAGDLAKQVSARAFTVGQDVYFGHSEYNLSSTTGNHLLAHEVTHTLQQDGAGAGPLTVSTPDSPAEREAEHVATQLVVGNPADVAGGHQQAVHRFTGPEHEKLGDATGATIDIGGGVMLTWGEVVALAGDQYGSVDELRAAVASADGKARLRHRLAHSGVHGPIPAGLPEPTGDQASNATFVDLALHNVSHFAAGGTAIETWRAYHESALLSALLSGVDDSQAEWQNAQLTEAFGQHFLTDTFSAGHVRTPRAEIIAWYQNDFAPRVVPALVAQRRQRVVQALTDDLARQMRAPTAAARAEFDALLGTVLSYLDTVIREQFTPLVGLGIAGAISGALHDQDNEHGVWVSSEAHPAPWLALGDNHLGSSGASQNQAELAVLTAREQLVQAQAIGRIRRTARGTSHTPPGTTGGAPGVVHFAFDSALIESSTAAALDRAANYLTAHPELVLDVIGHTCPLGSDPYNDALGARRAEAVAVYLTNRGVPAGRLRTASAGEHQLITADPGSYPSDRRAELRYRATGDEPADLVWAQQIIIERFGNPPYPAVERYVPHAVAGLNAPQEDWRWGTLTSTMASHVDNWIAGYVGAFRPVVAAAPILNDRQIVVPDLGPPLLPGAPPITLTPVTLHPRPAVLAIFDELLTHPTDFLGAILGIPAANRSA